MLDVLTRSYQGNTGLRWLIALAVFIGAFAALAVLRRVLLARIDATHPQTAARALGAEVLRHTRYTFLLILASAVASAVLALPPRSPRYVQIAVGVAVVIQVALWAHGIIQWWTRRAVRLRVATDAGSVTAVRALGKLALAFLWAVIALVVLATLGVDVTALVAGLGVGGIVVALAVQNIAADLFASVSIMLDKPFVVGDFIKVGDELGAVEDIGVKTTRVRSLSGEQLVFSNGDLLRSRIQNFRRMRERRVVLGVGVEYGTAPDTVDAIPELLAECIRAQPATRLDRSHFKGYGDSALLFEAVYYVLDPDYNRHMDIQQAIHRTLYRRFLRDGIAFAFPTRTVVLRRDPGDDTPAARDVASPRIGARAAEHAPVPSAA